MFQATVIERDKSGKAIGIRKSPRFKKAKALANWYEINKWNPPKETTANGRD